MLFSDRHLLGQLFASFGRLRPVLGTKRANVAPVPTPEGQRLRGPAEAAESFGRFMQFSVFRPIQRFGGYVDFTRVWISRQMPGIEEGVKIR